MKETQKLNKKGAAQIAIWVLVALVSVVALAITGVINLEQFAGGPPTGTTKSPTSCADSTATLTFPVVDAYNSGTTVTTDNIAKKTSISGDTAYVNTSATNGNVFGVGDKVQILYRTTNYIDVLGEEFDVNCGLTSAPEQKIYATNTNTFRIFNTNNQLLTDAAGGGATNQSNSASPISLEVKIDSRVDESTGDLLIVIESTNTTSTKSLTLSGPGSNKVPVPTFYTSNAALSVEEAYEIPAVLDGNTATYTLTIEPETGETVGAGDDSIYVTAYSKQTFRDTDGSFKTGVENAQGTTQHEDTWDFDFMIV